MKWSLMQYLSKSLDRKQIGDQKAPTLWPSSATAIRKNKYQENEIVGACRRATFFTYLTLLSEFDPKYKSELTERTSWCRAQPLPPEKLWIFKMGSAYERAVVDLAKESQIYVAEEVAVYQPTLNISGRIDLIIKNPENKKLQAVEIKSTTNFGGKDIFKSKRQLSKGNKPTPKWSNLMQIGFYQWWYAERRPDLFDNSLLIYGARDTGLSAEFEVWTEGKEKMIWYQPKYPAVTEPVDSGISIKSIGTQYKYILECIAEMKIPERDYSISYSDEKLALLYSRDELTKSETTQYEKWKDRKENGGRQVQRVKKGDWRCRYCEYQPICYGAENT